MENLMFFFFVWARAMDRAASAAGGDRENDGSICFGRA